VVEVTLLIRSTGTVHAYAKARLTNVAISVPPSGESVLTADLSVNHFPYLPIVTNPGNNPFIQTVIRIATKFNHLFTGPLPIFIENFMPIRFCASC